jgi:hypothetical protein
MASRAKTPSTQMPRGRAARPVPARQAPAGLPTPVPTTRQAFLLEMQQMSAAGVDQSEIIEYVYKVAEHCGIRVRHDQHDPHSLGPSVGARPATEAEAAAVVTAAAEAAAVVTAAAEAAAVVTDAAEAAFGGGAEGAAAAEGDGAEGGAEGSGVASGKRARRKAKKVAQAVPVSFVRQRDGTHQLAIGRFDDQAADDQAAPIRGATVGRLVLSGDKRGGGAARGRNNPLYYECNGLVIDARTWRALAIPPNAFSGRPSAKAIDGFLAENLYDIIRVDDGTVVTLYNWEHPTDGPTWALASSNGYDVSSLCWIGPLTYAAVFHDIAQRLYPAFTAETGMTLEARADGTTRLNFTNLDRARCYTVGFRHHNFHPMKADPERMWQIQSTDLSGAAPQVIFSGNGRGLPGVPDQHVYADDSFGSSALGGEALSLESLRAIGSNALARAAAYAAQFAAGEVPSGQPGTLPTELNYGYILRSRDPARTREHSDFLVETPLLGRIRKIVYERAPRSVRDSLVAADRLEYNAMRAFLTATERGDFLALYPDWTARFQAYEEFVNNVIHLVIHATRQRALAPMSREPSLKSPTGQVARALLDHICRFEKLTAFHKDTESIVRDYVINPEYALLFLRAMRTPGGRRS